MKVLVGLLVSGCLMSFAAQQSLADSFEIIRDGKRYSCAPAGSDSGDTAEGLCAEASLAKNGYITSDCQKVENDAQDRCAAFSIRKNGYVTSDCFKLIYGGQCAEVSLQKNGYVTSDCFKVESRAQDRCAAASLKKNGYVTSDCFRL